MDEGENWLPKGAALDADHYLRTEDPDEALDEASEMAEAAGMPFVVLSLGEGVFVVGPVDEVDVLPEGGKFLVIAAYDTDGEPADIREHMFSDDTVADRLRTRLSVPVREAWDAIPRPPANEARAARSATARCWREENLPAIQEYNAAVGQVSEMEVKHRRTLFTRRAALRKKQTVKDKGRRRVARNAKNWRLRNKSKAKRYGTLYHGPKTKVKEAAVDVGPGWRDVVVDPETGAVLREATEAEVLEALDMGGPLIVERRRARS